MQVRVFTDMFASILMNAYVLRRSKLKLQKTYTSFHFLEAILQQLAPEISLPHPQVEPPHAHPAGLDKKGQVRRVETPFWSKPKGAAFRLDGKDHWCQDANNVYLKFSQRQNDAGEFIRNELRRRCRWCNDLTVYFCMKCETPLCVGLCFQNFHTIREIKSTRYFVGNGDARIEIARSLTSPHDHRFIHHSNSRQKRCIHQFQKPLATPDVDFK